MPDTTAMPNTRVIASSVPQPDEIEIVCPRCKGFCVAVEPPIHRLEQNVAFRLRIYCKRCNRRFHRQITFSETRPTSAPPPAEPLLPNPTDPTLPPPPQGDA